MFNEVPIKLEPNRDHPMYKRAIRDALAIIDNEIESVRFQESDGSTYNTGKIYGFRRIKGLLGAMIEDQGACNV